MTNCSDFPRAFGTFPAGSAVRLKSRLALYSARGGEDVARARPSAPLLLGVVDLLRAGDRVRAEVFLLAAVFLLAVVLLLGADFLPAVRLAADRGPDRLVAMPPVFARTMPSTLSGALIQEPPGTLTVGVPLTVWSTCPVYLRFRVATRPLEARSPPGSDAGLRRMVPSGDSRATAEVTWGRGVFAPHVPECRSGRKQMIPKSAVMRTTLLAVGLTILATSTADAQKRRDPRVAVAASPRPQPQPVTGLFGVYDSRTRADQLDHPRRRDPRRSGPTIIYVPGGYGYGYAPGYYASPYVSSVSDAHGRPLWSGYENAPTPPSTGGYGYTPDLSGSPYAVSDEGMMVVDFASGERRAFPSCAESADQRDPQGRPRTIFYRPPDYWMILRPGQRGRVRGDPPTGKAACYAIDSTGLVVLRY